MKELFTPRDLAAIFRDRDIEPDEEFYAAAGQDYGAVAAWALPDGSWLIAYGDNAWTDYAIDKDPNDMAEWLINKNLPAPWRQAQAANVRGIGAVPEADPAGDGPCYILRTRDYNGMREYSAIVLDDNSDPRQFVGYADAAAWIAEAEGATYWLGPDDACLPSYKIVEG